VPVLHGGRESDIQFSVRIGVNRDLPLIAGVLETHNLVVDRIGEPINVLWSPSQPHTIQMPQSTYDCTTRTGFAVTTSC
jgi:hypothetical protein